MQAFSLTGKTILITGASSGIGRAMAIACAEAGAQLVISGRNTDRLTDTLYLLKGEGHNICVADLTNEDELAALVDFVPKLDGFVSNAGIANPLMLQFVEKQDVEQTLNTNAISVIHLTRLLLQEKN